MNEEVVIKKKDNQYICECGRIVTNKNKNKHNTTQIHKILIDKKSGVTNSPQGRNTESSVFETIQCPCDGHYNERSKSTHFRTKQHQDYVVKNKSKNYDVETLLKIILEVMKALKAFD